MEGSASGSDSVTLEEVYRRLLDALAATATPFAFIGALGAITWGRPRATTDLDLVVMCDEARFSALRDALVARDFTEGAGVGPADPGDPLPDIAVFWAGANPATRVDVFIAKLEFEREVVSRAKAALVFGVQAPVACPEAMLVYKLLAGRPKDLIDVDAIVESRALAGQAIDWSLARRWAAEWGIGEKIDALQARPSPT